MTSSKKGIRQKVKSIQLYSANIGDETLLTINPDLNKQHIHSVVVESNKISTNLGYKIGMKYLHIKTDIIASRCIPGIEEMSGDIICLAKSAKTISYIFSGDWSGPDGELPPQHTLNSWRLSKLLWSAMK